MTGVVVRKIPTDYSMAAGTGLISFENVKVATNQITLEFINFTLTVIFI